MSATNQVTPARSADPMGDTVARLIGGVLMICLALLALPLVVPFLVNAMVSDIVATRPRFWMILKGHRLANVAGILAVTALVTCEMVLLVGWVRAGRAEIFFAGDWAPHLIPNLGGWAIANLASGVVLLPVVWSYRRRRIADQVRSRRIPDVLRQERIEAARKRAADSATAKRIGVRLDGDTGRILGLSKHVISVPHEVAGRQSFGFINRATVRVFADRFHDLRKMRDWVDPTGEFVVLPDVSSAVRALIVAESGSGKTVLINGLVLCAVKHGWPVFVIDAKGDPADAESLVAVARSHGRTATVGGRWDLFNGTSDQVTSKPMRLMPTADGANQHYLDEIRGVLQAVQDASPIRSVADLRDRLTSPGSHVRDQFDLMIVNQTVDRNGTTAGMRAMHSLLVALRPLERFIGGDGWSYGNAPSDVTVIPLSPVDDAQAKLGDLLMLDLRNFLAARLQARDKSPVVVIVDEFPQLVTGGQDPGDTAGSLFETARSAGVGLGRVL